MDANWLKESEMFHEVYKKWLPVKVGEFTKNEIREVSYFSLFSYIINQLNFKINKINILKNIIRLIILNPAKKQNYSLLKRLFFN